MHYRCACHMDTGSSEEKQVRSRSPALPSHDSLHAARSSRLSAGALLSYELYIPTPR